MYFSSISNIFKVLVRVWTLKRLGNSSSWKFHWLLTWEVLDCVKNPSNKCHLIFLSLYLFELQHTSWTIYFKNLSAKRLRLFEVTSVFKKQDCMNKENYRPISILSHMSKMFERILYNQVNNFMKDKLSNILTGFSKGHSAQHSLAQSLRWKHESWSNFYGSFKGLWHPKSQTSFG